MVKMLRSFVRGPLEVYVTGLAGLTPIVTPAKAEGQQWTYDALGQPVSVIVGLETTSMAWGPDGSRWLVSDGKTTTWFSPVGQITWKDGKVSAASRAHTLGGAVVASTAADAGGVVRTVWSADDLTGDAMIQADPATVTASTGWVRQLYGSHGQIIGRTGDTSFAWAGTPGLARAALR